MRASKVLILGLCGLAALVVVAEATNSKLTCANVRCPGDTDCKINKEGRPQCVKKQPSKKDCDLLCTADYKPVCGSDGQTYSNECNLRVSNCNSGKNVTVAKQGECQSKPGKPHPHGKPLQTPPPESQPREPERDEICEGPEIMAEDEE